jgi:energy-coupling factor transporter transmembrane protein EcfT
MRDGLGSRLKGLAAGLTLLALFFMSMYGLLPMDVLPIYSYLRDALRLMMLGLGAALTIYYALGDRACRTASIFFAALAIVLCMFGGFLGPWAIIFMFSTVLAASCAAVYLPKKKVLRIVAIPLLFLFITLFIFYGTVAVLYLTVNPFDDPRRDKLNTELGYSLCGEYVIDIIPGKSYVIEWNRTLRGDEKLACYIKIRVSDPKKIAYIHYKYEARFEPRIKPGQPTPPGCYMSTMNTETLVDLRGHKELFRVGSPYFKGLSYSSYSTQINVGEDYTYLNRWDFYIVYMPAEPVPANFGEYASVNVSLRVVIDVIHPV